MAKSIMVQGTMSNAGKSLIAAALCRIFSQDGYRVAPFKSQNMALNSYITREGLEMGRAQVMQAEAAGIEPSVNMNPILLKPTGDTGSQIIVNGEVLGNMSAKDYFAYKKQLVPDIMEAYESLSKDRDVIVIEGAGSPAEINLKENDIVNMGMAELVDAPVLLVGDIDRGGVFAQMLGTVMLLTESERARVKGLVINKFRGDKGILDPGIAMLEEKCGIPVVGVIPYMRIDVDDEDSLSEHLEKRGTGPVGGLLDIAVIRLPHISNFTDLQTLDRAGEGIVRYVDQVRRLGHPDLVILPGTKNTMQDLKWLRESGLEAAILKLSEQGTRILGICGGYQMLGEEISDPNQVEYGGSMRGMGLLPMQTVFAPEKHRTRVIGRVANSGLSLEGKETWDLSKAAIDGYEIHMGESIFTEKVTPFAIISEEGSGVEREEGCISGNVCGTYIHGLFDGDGFAERFLQALGTASGKPYEAKAFDHRAYKNSQYDLLADTVRAHMDMEKIYRILQE